MAPFAAPLSARLAFRRSTQTLGYRCAWPPRLPGPTRARAGVAGRALAPGPRQARDVSAVQGDCFQLGVGAECCSSLLFSLQPLTATSVQLLSGAALRHQAVDAGFQPGSPGSPRTPSTNLLRSIFEDAHAHAHAQAHAQAQAQAPASSRPKPGERLLAREKRRRSWRPWAGSYLAWARERGISSAAARETLLLFAWTRVCVMLRFEPLRGGRSKELTSYQPTQPINSQVARYAYPATCYLPPAHGQGAGGFARRSVLCSKVKLMACFTSLHFTSLRFALLCFALP